MSVVLIPIIKDKKAKISSIDNYRPVAIASASKTFDRVKHSMLFTKLLRRGTPGYIVRLLMYWYAHQTMCVR